MSQILFDVPGPRARRRHLIYAALFVVAAIGVLLWAAQKLRAEGVLDQSVFDAVWSNTSLEYLWEGAIATLKAAAVAIVTAIGLGAALAAGRLSDHRWVRLPCIVWIEFFRAVPLVLLIIFFFFWLTLSPDREPFIALVVGLTLYNGAVLAEVFRAGVLAVARGQSEAAYALGMRKTQVMSLILMPQAVKFMLPAIISQSVIVLKDTSLGYVVTYDELVRHAKTLGQSIPDGYFLTYLTAAAWFIVINYSLSKLAEYLERRLARRGQGATVDAVEAAVADTGA